MLKLRIITALILLPLVVVLVLLAPTWAVAAATGVVVLLAAWEWLFLSHINSTIVKSAGEVLVEVLLAVL